MKKAIQSILYSMGLSVKLARPENYLWLQNKNLRTVLDIGANTGQFAAKINAILPDATIYSFEPIKKCFDELITKANHKNLQAFNFALGDKEEEIEINISKHSPSSSLLDMAQLHKDIFSGTDYSDKEIITVKRLDDIAEQLSDLDRCLIKIDVQGFEDRVIKGGMDTVKKADMILIETSYQELYKGQVLFAGIYKLLDELGFEFKGNFSQCFSPLDGSILYADSIFYNTRLNNGADY